MDQNAPRPMPWSAPAQVVVFVFDDLHDWPTLAAAAPAGAEVVLLDGWSDGLALMAAHLQGRSGIAAVHVLSHGTPGSLLLGSLQLTAAALHEPAHAQALATIGAALAEGADLLLYGCRAGAGDAGAALVRGLALATGADVAAASGLVGAAHLGGNWVLDCRQGSVGAAALRGLEHYGGTLAPVDQTFSQTPGLLGFGTTLDLNGVRYTLVGPGTYLQDIKAPDVSPLGDSNYLRLDANSAGATSIKVSATDASSFSLNALSFYATGSATTFTLTPLGGTAQTFSTNTGTKTTLSNLWNDPQFQNITEFTFEAVGAGTSIALSLDDLNFAPNVAPTFTATSANPTFTEGGSAVDLFGSVTAATNDAGQTFTGMEITVSNVGNGAAETLKIGGFGLALNDGNTGSVPGGGSFSVALAAGTATVTFTGLARSDADMATLVDGLAYHNASNNPGNASRVVTITSITDSGGSDHTAMPNKASTVGVSPVNSAPVLAPTGGPAFFVETANAASTPVALDPGIGVTDLDHTALVGATVSITGGFVSGQDVLAFTNAAGMGNIAGSYAPGTGVLMLTSAGGTATLAEWQAALRSVTYVNSSHHPDTTGRTITFKANDGSSDSNLATKAVVVMATNDAPVNTAPATQTVAKDGSLLFSGGNQISVSDAEVGGGNAEVTLTASNGTLTLSGVAGLVFSVGDGTGDATMMFEGPLASINTALNGLKFTPTAGYAGPAVVTIHSSDKGESGAGGIRTDSDSVNITVTAAAPTITSATYDAASGTLVVTGTDLPSLAGAANDIDGSKFCVIGEGFSSYQLTDTACVEITSATSLTLTLSATDRAAVNRIVNKNGTQSTGGQTYDLAALEGWAAGANPALSIIDPVGNPLSVSGVAVPAVTSASYQAASGTLVVTGTGFLSRSGAANDIVANKLTFTGQGGAPASYTLTDTANVDATSGTSFTLTLSTNDWTAVNALLNKAGTSSADNTTYNIAFADNWNAGADAAINIADLAGNAVNATGFAPVGGGGGGGGGGDAPPSPPLIDGVPVTINSSNGSTTMTVAPVPPGRTDTPNSLSPLADIPITKGSDGRTTLQVGLPTGAGLHVNASSDPAAVQYWTSAVLVGVLPLVPSPWGSPSFVSRDIASVAYLKPGAGTGFDPKVPLVISGSSLSGDGKQLVIVDVSSLPRGSIVQVDNVGIIAVIGGGRLIGGAGQNSASGDGAVQWMVLGPEDDVIHGGGGDDTIGSLGGNDQLYGDEGNDTVFGGEGQDLLAGGTGSDRLNGGTGFDVALQEGKRSDYTVTVEAGGIKLTHTASGESDWFVDVEQIRFETGPGLTVVHSAAEEAGAYLFQTWLGRALTQDEGAVLQTLTGQSALQVAALFAQLFPQQTSGKTAAQLLEGMAASTGIVRVDAVREVVVAGDAGHNTIQATLGLARYVDGGAGIDTVVVPATLAQSHLQWNSSSGSYTLQRLTDGAMLDLAHVERVVLSDTKLALDVANNGHAGQAAKLLGVLGGPALLANKGLVGEAIRALDNGVSAQGLATIGLQALGAQTPTQVVQLLWTQLMGRPATQAELQPLVDLMGAGGLSVGEFTVLAGNLDLNATRIDLVGLAARGMEFA